MKILMSFSLCLFLTGGESLQATLLQTPPPQSMPGQVQLIPYLKGKKWGYADTSRRLVIPAIYDHCNRTRILKNLDTRFDKFDFR